MKKQCYKCNQYKSFSDFSKCKGNKDGLQRKCKTCEREIHKQRYDNPEMREQKIKKTCECNKIRRNDETEEERKYRLNVQKTWYEKHKKEQSEYRKEYMKDKTNKAWVLRKLPRYIIANRCRAQLRNALCNAKKYLKSHTKDLLGVSSWEEAKNHIEARFTDGMNWNNMDQWHIDHIKPISLFNLEDPIQLAECFNIKNLQPLWAIDNIKKSNKY
jgi:hypothetical protein